MKKHIVWIALVAVGVLLIVGNLLYPLIVIQLASTQTFDEPVAIIGGADIPTFQFAYSLAMTRTNIALIALGGLSLLAGIVVAVATLKKSRG